MRVEMYKNILSFDIGRVIVEEIKDDFVEVPA